MRHILTLSFLLFSQSAFAFVFSYGSAGATTEHHKKSAEALMKAFRSDNPGVEVELRASTSYLKPISETLMQSFGGDAPDLGVVGLVEWPVLVQKKLLTPLQSVLSNSELAQIRKNIRPELLVQYYGNSINEKDFVLPFNRSIPVLYVNLELLPKFEKISPTWDDLENSLASRKPTQQIVISTDDWIAEQILVNARGTPTLIGAKARFTDPSVIKVLERIKAMKDKGLVALAANLHEAYSQFIEGKAAAVLLSQSSYESVLAHAKFQLRISMPPLSNHKVVVLGGGDLIVPLKGRAQSEKTKRELRTFLKWFYLGRGNGLWASLTGYLPDSKSGENGAEFKKFLSDRPMDAPVYLNKNSWRISSFYHLDEYCRIVKLREAVSNAFRQVLSSADIPLVLNQAEAFVDNIIAKETCL